MHMRGSCAVVTDAGVLPMYAALFVIHPVL